MDELLLIDDEPDILRVLSMSLKAGGYHVVTAQNGPEGIAAFEKDEAPKNDTYLRLFRRRRLSNIVFCFVSAGLVWSDGLKPD